MRICHYLRGVRVAEGGVTRAVLDLTALLARRGHRVTLATADPHDVPDSWRSGAEGEPRLVEVSPPGLARSLLPGTPFPELEPLIAEADVLHLHTPWEVSNIAAAREARDRGVPFVLSTHGMLDDWAMGRKTRKKRLYLALFARRLLRAASIVHSTSQMESEESARWIGGVPMRVAPLAMDLTEFDEIPDPAEAREAFSLPASGPPVALFLSRLHPGKRVELLLEAAKIAEESGRPFRVVVAGEGDAAYERRLRATADRLNLRESCRFLGAVFGPLKLSLYAAADVFVLPSIHENFGLVATEAMACGTPAVVTEGVSIWRELVSSGAAAVASDDPDDIAAKMASMRDQDDATILGTSARRFVFDWLSPENALRRYEAVYEEAIQIGLEGRASRARPSNSGEAR